MSRPMVVCAVCLCCGIAGQGFLNLCVFFWIVICLLLLVAAACFMRRDAVFAVSFCLLMATAGALRYSVDRILPEGHISQFHGCRAEFPCRIRGSICSEPVCSDGRAEFVLESREIETTTLCSGCSGKVLMRVFTDQDLSFGEELFVEGKLHGFPRKASGARTDYGQYLRSRKIFSAMHVVSPACVRRTGNIKAPFYLRLAYSLKKKSLSAMRRWLPPVPAGIVCAMVVGEKRFLPPAIVHSMMCVGTVHILVVSGFNVGVVSGLLLAALKLCRLPRRPRIYTVMPVLALYCLATGGQDPVVRATIMGAVFLLGYCFQREADVLSATALSALIILLWQPQHIFDAGFQLSFASVLSLGICAPWFSKRVNVPWRFGRWLFACLNTSVCAWLGTCGIVAYHFKQLPVAGILANIFIPVIAAAITVCGIGLALSAFLSPWCAKSFAAVIELLVFILLRLNAFFYCLPWGCLRLA